MKFLFLFFCLLWGHLRADTVVPKIWLVSEINLQNLSWSDLGLENQGPFVGPMREAWKNWLHEKRPQDPVAICEESCQAFMKEWTETPVEEMSLKEKGEFTDALWLKVSFNLKKSEKKIFAAESAFEWSARVLLMDINTKRILASSSSEDFVGLGTLEQKESNSQLASRMVRTAQESFLKFFPVLDQKLRPNRLSHLVIKGHFHLGDAFAFMEELRVRTDKMGMESALDYFTKDEAHFLCFYQGEEKSFSDLLSGLKELKSSQRYAIVTEVAGTQLVVRMIAE